MSLQEIIVRATGSGDVATLADLLNDIIRVGTTAHEIPLSPSEFEAQFLTGEQVVASYVAQLSESRDLMGFQTIVRDADLPDAWVDIATFARMNPKIPTPGADSSCAG